ncbi:MAG: hypothetical protein LBB81_08290 [Treponema sp.]|jgi:hypothetical protein|nr:hypothetical protein [Treponema sp.]
MQIEINTRGNGACPICESSGNCQIQDTLTQTLELFTGENDLMELVIYSCPQFEEKL